MSDLKTAAQQALEALTMMRDEYEEYACPACDHADAAIYALRDALAEPDRSCPTCVSLARAVMMDQTGYDTAPPQRKPLSEEEIGAVCAQLGFAQLSPVEVARAIEQAHGIGGQE